MDASVAAVSSALDRRYLVDFPGEAARWVEDLGVQAVTPALAVQTATVLRPMVELLATDTAATLMNALPSTLGDELFAAIHPGIAVEILGQWPRSQREETLKRLPQPVRDELTRFMEYAPGSVARVMDTRFIVLRPGMTVDAAIKRLRQSDISGQRTFFIVNDENRVRARVEVEDLLIAQPDTVLDQIAKPVPAVLDLQSTEEEMAELVGETGVATFPVINATGRLVGILRPRAAIRAVEESASADIQTMVGASPSEHGLSPPFFAVRKRLSWLTINLVTAFMAAAVVGLFEGTISKYTALAVLLPVVAGQAGNSGAQALAVTMRALTLREIGIRMWLPVLGKEIAVGILNGLAIAAICAIFVWLWSHSVGLTVIIAAAMVASMVIAGVAGALVPMALIRFGLDPAAASSIVLTTITDIAGFFSFLGIATVLAFMI